MDPMVIHPHGQSPHAVSFNGPINSHTASVLMGTLANAANEGCDDIHLLLSTPGGQVADGIALYNSIRALHPRITTYNMGAVNSIGNVVYQAADRRVCSTTASFMFHGIGFDIPTATRLELQELREKTKNLESDQASISTIMVRHSNLSTEDVDRLFLEMAFVDADEALKHGITDQVADVRLPPRLPVVQLIFQG